MSRSRHGRTLVRTIRSVILVLFCSSIVAFACSADTGLRCRGAGRAGCHTVQSIRDQIELNKPLWQQYLQSVVGVFHGGLGRDAEPRPRAWFNQFYNTAPCSSSVSRAPEWAASARRSDATLDLPDAAGAGPMSSTGSSSPQRGVPRERARSRLEGLGRLRLPAAVDYRPHEPGALPTRICLLSHFEGIGAHEESQAERPVHLE
jgi:hypothetical protein